MSDSATKLEYSIGEYWYEFEQSGYQGKVSNCIFRFNVVMNGGHFLFDTFFFYLLELCEEHDPRLYAYIKGVEESVNSISDDEKMLIAALKTEEFDFMRLMTILMDNYDPEKFYDSLNVFNITMKNKGDGTVKAMTAQLVKVEDKTAKTEWSDMDRFIYKEVVADALYQSAKNLAYKTFRKLPLLGKKEKTDFLDILFHYAYHVGGVCAEKVWLAEGFKQPDEEQLEIMRQFEPEGRRAKIIKNRWHKKENPPFSLEYFDSLNEWNAYGRNTAKIYFKVTTAEGIGYGSVGFRCLKDEAYLNFPPLYERIMALEASFEAIHPKENQVLQALLDEGWDLVPVLYSYAKDYAHIKMEVMIMNMATEKEIAPWGSLGDYNEVKAIIAKAPSSLCKWRQTCSIAEDKLRKIWIEIIQKECAVLFETADYRLRGWALREAKVAASNLFYDIINEFDVLSEEQVVWGKGIELTSP